MKKLLSTIALFAFIPLLGCPATTTAPAPQITGPVHAWSVWIENGRAMAREVFNLEELTVAVGDTAVNLDFSGGSFTSGKIGYKLVGMTDITYIAVTPDKAEKSAGTESTEKYLYDGYPYGFYWDNVWYPDGYWNCYSCSNVWYHGACPYHGVHYGYVYINTVTTVDNTNFWVIAATLLAAVNFPATAAPITDNGEFSITVPMGPTVETAVLNVETKNGSFITTIHGEAYNRETAPAKFTLTTSAQGSGTVTGAGSYDKGTQVTITATPATGWTFDHWTVNGAVANNNPGIVKMDGDVAVVAYFVQNAVQQYTLTTQIVGQGAISGGGPYNSGATASVTANPSAGWHFDHWSGDLSGSVNPASVVMNGNKSVTAVFVQDVIPTDNRGKLIVDLTTAAGIVSFKINTNGVDGYTAATFGSIGDQSQINSMGLQLFYTAAVNGLWTDRQVFPFNGTWPVTGVLTKVSGKTLRFEVVANAANCWGDPDKLRVKLNSVDISRVTDQSGTAYQVTLP